MDLTDEELDELHSLLQEELLYGDDELVYMTSENGRLQNERLTSIIRKVEDEAKGRGRWWAR
jgi:succinate dehydrogenase flavin-adding protein (antitoxin of CptAB toxin-antitoxin module)